MGRLEVNCRRFAILSGVEQEGDYYAVCVHPSAPALQRKGTLAIMTEAGGAYASLGVEACKLVQRVTVETYFSDNSLSLTSSLLNALDQANTELLNYNYRPGNDPVPPPPGGDVAVQGGGNKPRRAKVGATALLIRPDGAGVYLSQMAPTQAYLLHNGMLSAIPEPAAWKPAPQRSVAVMSGVQAIDELELEPEPEADELSVAALPSPSLGSGPGIEADLIYRRIAPGDMVVLVSTSLARHLDRDQATQLFSRYDADGVIRALHTLAMDNGLAEAHACVLELGVSASSGVDEDYATPVKPAAVPAMPAVPAPESESVPLAAPVQPQQKPASAPNLREVLRGPRDWLQRRRVEPVEPANGTPAPLSENISEQDADMQEFWSQQPTQRFPQRPVDLPPYRARQKVAETADAAPIEPAQAVVEDEARQEEELEFDGWEDTPPALDNPRYDASHKIVFKPQTYDFSAASQESASADESESPVVEPDPLPVITIEPAEPRPFPRPSLFGGSSNHGSSAGAGHASGRTLVPDPQQSKFDVRTMARGAAGWTLNVARALLPDRLSSGTATSPGSRSVRGLPLRFVILGALVVAALLLTVSVISMAGNAQKAATRNLLQEAQQMETLANQPGMLPDERVQKLQLALSKAQEAAAATPQSPDAKLLVTKIQGEIDQALGITRFGSVKPLFDLDAIDKGSAAAAPAGVNAQNSITATEPIALSDIIVQSNDLYMLDRSVNKIYRCQLATSSCAAVLTGGDAAGGSKVGKVVAMTMRVGNVVAIDDTLTAYILSPDTGAWQAEKLGGADTLHSPKAIATYDGNIYLLEAKPGQISKYPSGQYGEPPIDWIQDPATIDAMKAPVTIAIDGEVYVALADGKILVMQGGKLSRTLTPATAPGQSAPTSLFTNPDIKDLYALRAEDGTITRISKEGQALATFKAPLSAGLEKLSGMTVDEGRGKYYLVAGRKIFEASMAAPTTTGEQKQVAPAIDVNSNSGATGNKSTTAPSLSVRPTAAP